ncbi:hypothetical protein HDV01_000548 [Terramyces sp. JEL0728]|nr:hypothetical protein HDV01_000548 [Terramyces sp. JEL0728]
MQLESKTAKAQSHSSANAPSSSKAPKSQQTPRTQHSLETNIAKLDDAKKQILTSEAVIQKLFSPSEQSLPSHESDLELEDANINESQHSLIDYSQDFKKKLEYKGFKTVLTGEDNSLQRSLAHQLYGDPDLYEKIDKMIYNKQEDYLQAVANAYNQPIHIHKTIPNDGVQVVTPHSLDFGLSLNLLQYGNDLFCSLVSGKKVTISEEKRYMDSFNDLDLDDEIAKEFMNNYEWTELDQKKLQLTKLGPGSLQDNINLMETQSTSYQELDLHDMNECSSSLGTRVRSTNFSPPISRRYSDQSSLNEDEFRDLQKALEESLHDIPNQESYDPYDEELQIVLELSRRESLPNGQGSAAKGKAQDQGYVGKGKAPMK